MPHKNATFCISWKEKILDEPLKKNQQNTNHNKNWFVNVPKSSQMRHWSKAKVAKLEKIILLIL
jgi:hypothetical protein